MIDWLNAHGAQVIEVDTDGIYFVPPASVAGGADAGRGKRDDVQDQPRLAPGYNDRRVAARAGAGIAARD